MAAGGDFLFDSGAQLSVLSTRIGKAIGLDSNNDGFLNDIQGRHVRAEHVWAALESAAEGPVAEGAVGAGMGTTCFGWKGGIGTASRLLPPDAGGFVVGALVQSNFGRTGKLFAFETYGLEPDIVVLGKGLGNGVPVAAADNAAHGRSLPWPPWERHSTCRP